LVKVFLKPWGLPPSGLMSHRQGSHIGTSYIFTEAFSMEMFINHSFFFIPMELNHTGRIFA